MHSEQSRSGAELEPQNARTSSGAHGAGVDAFDVLELFLRVAVIKHQVHPDAFVLQVNPAILVVLRVAIKGIYIY
jgi:hypothetical protein